MKLLALAAAAAVTTAPPQAPALLAFVACPIMRDTATAPCWLADYKGELYSLDASAQPRAPALGHLALIEGMPTDQTRCGGKVMADLHVSILPDRDPACDTILPATDAFQLTDLPRSAGPSASPAGPGAAGPELVAAALTGSQRFEVHYDFDWQTAAHETGLIQEAAAYARANPKAEVHVAGFRASVKLAGGRVLTEGESIAVGRARELVETLVTLGVDRATILVVDNPAPDLGDHTRRRATIDVVMGGSPDEHSEH